MTMHSRKHTTFVLLALILCIFFAACGTTKETTKEAVYMQISAEEAKNLMDTEKDYVILDVRTQEEYDQGHIPGAVVIPHTEISARAEEELPRKEQMLLVYCRSGNRSKQAARALAELGYTDIREFGGILDWPYEVVKE